ncbi:NAD(P)H-dependent glycerol-3-phosphate dehydrogenase [Halioglobus maricola]|uniref:Glycerol-3-phosphate dehydrogenase [NAD(P)+] n=1 Tax=Halioglobus maricola TaxID=2601894 RepID=A0A5P9NLD3_9GAMM|nr:NAD(P)H-dependent glycerol-3-phosphate dehydrogenase [Halioglobus maricola]QFU76054.1 NAD(P)H-dependent glycerol-3-phosphate dehydrogenase [Halioglobus maricola]
MERTYRVAVLGGGSFGTVIGNIIAENGHSVRLWLRNRERAQEINSARENHEYLPGYQLSDNLVAYDVLAAAVSEVDLVFVAVPSGSFRTVVAELSGLVAPEAVIVSLTKGIEADGFKLMSQILREEMPGHPIGVLSGPNLAGEIARGHISGSVIASELPAVTRLIHDLLHCPAFLIYSSHDMYGVELGGALKNVYAILSGVGAALDFGENTVGMLLTRALAEMSRFAVHMGANPMTFLGLSGVGDLVVTCSSPLSRNYRVGMAVAHGQPLEDVLAGMDQVAEGINTLALVKCEADRRGVDMPLVDGLYRMLHEQQPVEAVFNAMMSTEEAQDVEFVVR